MVINLIVVLILALLGIITNIVTSDESTIPFLEVARRWSLPLLGVMIILLLIGTAWQHLIEHPSSTRSWTAKRPPFPGLEAFTEEDTSVFFGREKQIDDLIQRLHPLLPRNIHRFVAVIGPSGSGKSSLVQAGLLPRLKQSNWVIVPPFLPGDHPITHLATSFYSMQSGGQVGSIIEKLAHGPLALIELAASLRSRHRGRNTKVLLVIDQAEELITLSGANERDEFLKLLRGAIRQDRNLWIIATLRSEFLTAFLKEGYADLFSDPVVLGSLDRKALFKVIEEPALGRNVF